MTYSPSFYMQQALEQAAQALLLSNPNPRVGCVLVGADGQTIGQGFTQQAGGPHAEVMALRHAAAQGHSTQGATAYVTLEPCSHHGRTGPCCDALIAAGVAKVVAAIADPNPQVAGQGLARLQAAGVAVALGPDAACTAQAQALNVGFFSRMQRGRPWVRLKAATSLDGASALGNGASQWITSAAARADGHAWRARACAVLTGIGTVLADNPQLDVRALATPRQPHVVVVDSQLRMPLDAHVLRAGRACFIYTSDINHPKTQALQALGATVIAMPNAQGQVDLAAMLADLGQRHINELHVEAGAALNGALLGQGLVDELLLYQAPKLLGQGCRGMADWGGGPLESLDQALQWHIHDLGLVGPDIRILARQQPLGDGGLVGHGA